MLGMTEKNLEWYNDASKEIKELSLTIYYQISQLQSKLSLTTKVKCFE